MRSTLLRERSLHVELHTLLAAPVARDLAGQVCHNRGGDARPYHLSKWHYRQRKFIFELVMHFIADTDTDDNCFDFLVVADAEAAVLCTLEWAA